MLSVYCWLLVVSKAPLWLYITRSGIDALGTKRLGDEINSRGLGTQVKSQASCMPCELM